MDKIQFAIETFIYFIVIVDPFSVLPLFIILTRGQTDNNARQTALKACVMAFSLLVGFSLIGDWILSRAKITTPALEIAGGILLMFLALDMIFARHSGITSTTEAETEEATNSRDISVFPLAIPLIAGPGSFTMVTLHMNQINHDPLSHLITVIVLAILFCILFTVLSFSSYFNRLLGITGVNVMSRVLGVILAGLAVEFVIRGIRSGVFAVFFEAIKNQ